MRLNSKIKTAIALSIVAVSGVIAIYFAITMANNMERYGIPFFDAKAECAKQLEKILFSMLSGLAILVVIRTNFNGGDGIRTHGC